MGYSGAGISTDLRRVIEKEKLWDKYGVNVKAIYFNSGSVLTQAIAGGNINISDSDVPAMLGLSVSGIMDLKVISVTFNRLEHIFVVRKNIAKPEELKGKTDRRQPDRLSVGHRDPHGDTSVEDRSREGGSLSFNPVTHPPA